MDAVVLVTERAPYFLRLHLKLWGSLCFDNSEDFTLPSDGFLNCCCLFVRIKFYTYKIEKHELGAVFERLLRNDT